MATISGIEGLLAGRTLVNRYLVEEVIGRGGMGAVYRARDRQLGREVAVKVITVAAPDREAHERLRARFQREARAAAALHHPCVVAVHDYGTDPALGLDFIVMELLRGEDLASRLERKGPPAAPTALSVLEQAARGLAAGHRAGLIHRDVKPGNIYLEAGDRVGEVRVKILDFGIAELSHAEGDTMTQLTVMGRSPFSPSYASPEQLRGESRLTPATDVFSLGAVALHLFTGRRPFVTPEARQARVELSRTLAEERPRLDRTVPGLAAVLERALADAPADRHPDAGRLADELLPLRAVPTAPVARATPAPEHTELAPHTARPVNETRFHDATDLVAAPPAGFAAAASLSRPPLTRRAGVALKLRRAGARAWQFLLTATATALFAGSWVAAFLGATEGSVELVYAGAAVSVIATPLALHRLMGSRGLLGPGIFATLAVTLTCVYWLGSGAMEVVLGAVFVGQIAASLLVERLTSRRHASAVGAHADT